MNSCTSLKMGGRRYWRQLHLRHEIMTPSRYTVSKRKLLPLSFGPCPEGLAWFILSCSFMNSGSTISKKTHLKKFMDTTKPEDDQNDRICPYGVVAFDDIGQFRAVCTYCGFLYRRFLDHCISRRRDRIVTNAVVVAAARPYIWSASCCPVFFQITHVAVLAGNNFWIRQIVIPYENVDKMYMSYDCTVIYRLLHPGNV